MFSRLIISGVFLVVVLLAGGFVVLAAWDIPVVQKPVEKTLDIGAISGAADGK